jgi:hypothetical protein
MHFTFHFRTAYGSDIRLSKRQAGVADENFALGIFPLQVSRHPQVQLKRSPHDDRGFRHGGEIFWGVEERKTCSAKTSSRP